MKLASGAAPIPEFLEREVNVGLGTDGVKENNNLDMFEEMKFASLLQKVHHLDATIMDAETTFRYVYQPDGSKTFPTPVE
jgi:5-methylthioadenosine/S-adenosylhomocysteine deaminase